MKVVASYRLLSAFTREQLRALCRAAGIEIGRNKIDTINNLILSNVHIELVHIRLTVDGQTVSICNHGDHVETQVL